MMLPKYFKKKQKNTFVDVLASCHSSYCYVLSKKLWIANRLGLYRTVINQYFVLPHNRNFVVKSTAKIKRYSLTELETIEVSKKILTSWRYNHLHQEYIKETIYLIPNFYLHFFQNNPSFFNNGYNLAAWLSLREQVEEVSHQCDSEVLDRLPDNIDADFLRSNLSSNTELDKLKLLNKWMRFYKLTPVQLINPSNNLSVRNLGTGIPKSQINTNALVTILVTCYNAEGTIKVCIDSLLAQTWKDIEVIVVDDNSEDKSLIILQKISKRDSRVKLISLSTNIGTFAAKSIGAMHATGEFLTCQDSDDWGHPQKIAEQVLPLIHNPTLVATTSQWFRIDDKGDYYSRKVYPYVTQNPASPLFRLNKIKKEIGLWHIVRTGADSEFYERLKLVYGANKIFLVDKPLTIASHRENSLMTSKEYGTQTKKVSLSRLDYWESWRLWHIEQVSKNKVPFMPDLQSQIESSINIFVPMSIKVSKDSLLASINKL